MIKQKILNTKAEEIGERTVRFKISSEVVDRDGDTLIAEGCDFTNFAKNPQFLSFHNSRDFPLGIPKNWKVEDGAVYCDVYFPTLEELSSDPNTASEKAKLVDFTYHCYKMGMLNAVSVGFIVKDYDEDKETGGYKITSWELLEFSAVAVPANQDALAQAVKSFGDDGAKKIFVETKSGRKISAETRKTLDEISENLAQIESCSKKIKTLMKTLEEDEEKEETEPKPETEPTPEEEPTPENDDGKGCGDKPDDEEKTLILDDEFNLADL